VRRLSGEGIPRAAVAAAPAPSTGAERTPSEICIAHLIS